MTRKRFACIAVLLLSAVGGGTGGVFWATLQIPDFYQQVLTEAPDRSVRKAAAKKLVQRTLQLVDQIQHADVWSEEFAQTQVNSWLAEELHTKYADQVPKGVIEPRVRFADESVQIGFRFEGEDWNGVVSLQLKPWVTAPNQLALEIESIKAGLVPIPLEDVLDEVSKRFETEGLHVEWKHSNGNDVLIVHLEEQMRDDAVLESVQVLDGALRVSGRRGSESEPTAVEIPRVADQSGSQ